MSKYEEMDQSHWLCYQFPDQSYYYGEVGYLDEAGVVHGKDSPEASSPNIKLVKHGFGIYLYNTQNQNPSKYEGYWDRDRKQGQGKLTVPGQFIYEGTFKEGTYHQHGKMQWQNGDCYDGNWKKNRMEGGGIFKHHEGFTLKGSFKANYFMDQNFLRNPQMSQKQYILFRKQGKEVAKQKERNEKIKSGFIQKIKSSQNNALLETILKSNNNNRVPLIIASENAKFNIKTLEQTFSTERKCNTFDLRKAYLLKGEEKFNYKQTFSEMTRQALRQGEALIINLDQSQNPYHHAFYPDLKQFYDSTGFNQNTWSRQTMKRKEVHSKVTGETISNNYVIAIWSKIKLQQQLTEEQIRQKLQLRLQSILPFIKLDIIMMVGAGQRE